MPSLIRCSLLLPEQPAQSLASHRQLSPWVLVANDYQYFGLARLVVTPSGKHWVMKSGDVLTLATVTQWCWLAQPRPEVTVQDEQLFDADGLPSPYAHQLLMTWDHNDPLGWIRLAQRLWQSEGCFSLKAYAEKWVADINTAGRAGNEGLLQAMERNPVLWLSSWRSSQARGHCVLEVCNSGLSSDASRRVAEATA